MVPPFAPRSTVMTGIFAALIFLIVGTIASLSVGLIATSATFFWMRSSMPLASLAESFCASRMMRFTFAVFAAAWAPSRRSTKNGLFSVEMDNPTVCIAAPCRGKTVRPRTIARTIRLALRIVSLLYGTKRIQRMESSQRGAIGRWTDLPPAGGYRSRRSRRTARRMTTPLTTCW